MYDIAVKYSASHIPAIREAEFPIKLEALFDLVNIMVGNFINWRGGGAVILTPRRVS